MSENYRKKAENNYKTIGEENVCKCLTKRASLHLFQEFRGEIEKYPSFFKYF